MNKSRFAFLLNRHFAGLNDEDEAKELRELIHAGSSDEELKAMIEKYLDTDPGANDLSPSDADEVLQNILMDSQSEYETNKVIPIRRTFWTPVRYAAAAIVVLGLGVGGWFVASTYYPESTQIAQRDDSVTSSKHQNKIEESVFTGKQFIRLPDGSTVLLNANSELRYGKSFGDGTREVSLKGEGFFDIAHDASKPFLVKANGITTTVLGTAFNVRAYPEDKEVKVTVTRGKVKVGDDVRTFGVIIPDQQIVVEAKTHDFVQSELKASKETAWMNSSLILDDVNMETAAVLIAARYNTKVIFSKESIKACRIRAEFLNGETLQEVLEVVGAVIQASYEIQADGNVKLEGKGCE